MVIRLACVFLFYFVLFVTGGVRYDNENLSDYTYIEPAEAWLKLQQMPATFINAFLHCKLEGAVLASPLNNNLQKAMGIMQDTLNIHSPIFTGIHATISKNDLTSIEGFPLSNMPVTWAPDGTDNIGKECIIMLRNGTIALANCTNKYRYVCYIEKTTNPGFADCGTLDTGYERDPFTGSCYKFHRHSKTWRRAQMTCLAEGGHLAIINNFYEANILKDLFAENPRDVIRGSRYPDTVSIGYLDWNKRGAWYTVDGKSLDEAGYSKWDCNSPNNRKEYDGGQYCGCLLRNGKLDDVWCKSVPLPFICEKTYNSHSV